MKNTQFRDEPNMEEVLASIRQIITEEIQEETALKAAHGGEALAEKGFPSPLQNDILELTELVRSDGSIESLKHTSPSFEASPPAEESAHSPLESSIISPSLSQAATSSTPYSQPSFETEASPEEDILLSPETLAASAAAMATLSTLSQAQATASSSLGDKTLEQLMQDMLRPLLKEWLDIHLPGLVKQVVQEQVEKVIKHQRKAS